MPEAVALAARAGGDGAEEGEEGREEGREEGDQEDREEGDEEGREEGREEDGREEAAAATAGGSYAGRATNRLTALRRRLTAGERAGAVHTAGPGSRRDPAGAVAGVPRCPGFLPLFGAQFVSSLGDWTGLHRDPRDREPSVELGDRPSAS